MMLEKSSGPKTAKDDGGTVVTMDSVEASKAKSAGKSRRGGKRPGKGLLDAFVEEQNEKQPDVKRPADVGTVDSRQIQGGEHRTKRGGRRPSRKTDAA